MSLLLHVLCFHSGFKMSCGPIIFQISRCYTGVHFVSVQLQNLNHPYYGLKHGQADDDTHSKHVIWPDLT